MILYILYIYMIIYIYDYKDIYDYIYIYMIIYIYIGVSNTSYHDANSKRVHVTHMKPIYFLVNTM